MMRYESKISLVLGAHVHHSQFRLFKDKIPMFLTPSFSTYAENNPGFATIELDDFASNLWTHHIDLFEQMNKNVVKFNTFDFSKLGLDEIKEENVRSMLYNIWTSKEYTKHLLAYFMGYTPEHAY